MEQEQTEEGKEEGRASINPPQSPFPPVQFPPLPPGAKKVPGLFFRRSRANTWQRPTLAGPFAQLPSAQQRFTSGFGMGPGGSTTLWSPEGNSVVSYGTGILAAPACAGATL